MTVRRHPENPRTGERTPRPGNGAREANEPPGTVAAVAVEWADAVRAWCRDHATNWPAKHGTCPACKGTGCFGRADGNDDPPRWICFDTDHAGVGREGKDKRWRGDALDLEAHARRKTLAEVLRDDGYLTGTRPAGGARRAPAPPPAKLPPLVLPRPTPVAADAEALAGWRLDGTIFASVREYGNGEPLRLTWAELVELFREPTTLPGAAGGPMDDRKKQLPAWNGGRFEGGTSAKRGQSKRASALLLDLDADPTKPAPKCGEPDLTPDKLRAVLADVLPGVAWGAHTSSSSTPGCWRWRVVVPLAEELEAGPYVAVVDLLRLRLLSWSAAPFALEADVNANRALSRLWYAAARVPERPGDYATAEAAGTLLDGLALLESTAAAVGVKLADLPARLTADCESKRTPEPERGPDHAPTEAPPMPNQSDDPGWDPDDPGAGGAPDDEPPAGDGGPKPPGLEALRVGAFAGKAFELFERRRDGLEPPVPLPPKWGRVAAELRGGLWAGCYVLVGGTGVGKSQWAFEVAYHAVTRTPDPVPVLYVGLELDRAGVVARLTALGMHGRTASATGAPERVAWSDLYLGEREALELADGAVGREVRGKLAAAPFYFVAGEAMGGWSYAELRGLVDRLRALHPSGPALVIVDFLQLVGSPPGEREELRERIGKASYMARMVAREHRVSVLLLSATARSAYPLFAGEGKGDGGDVSGLGEGDPGRFLGTGKESGEVEYSADGVIALCRGKRRGADVLNPNPPPAPVWLAVAKSRTGRPNGLSGWAALRFDGTSFAALTEAEQTDELAHKGGRRATPAASGAKAAKGANPPSWSDV